MEVVFEGVKPYDGRWPLDISGDALTTVELGWVKRLSGWLPAELEKAFEGGDAEFRIVLACIALCRAGRIEERDVPDTFDRLAHVAVDGAIMLDFSDEPEPVEDDASPPEESSTSSSDTSGPGLMTSSETSPRIRTVYGTPASDGAESVQLRSVI